MLSQSQTLVLWRALGSSELQIWAVTWSNYWNYSWYTNGTVFRYGQHNVAPIHSAKAGFQRVDIDLQIEASSANFFKPYSQGMWYETQTDAPQNPNGAYRFPYDTGLGTSPGSSPYTLTVFCPNTLDADKVKRYFREIGKNPINIYNPHIQPVKQPNMPYYKFPAPNIIRGLNDFSQSEYQY